MNRLHLSVIPMLFLTALAGCSSSPALVTNPQTGETASCAITAMTKSLAEQVAGVCQKNYEAAGWVSAPAQIAETRRTVGL